MHTRCDILRRRRIDCACRFTDCSHRANPAARIQCALDDGSLDSDRWQSYQKLQREQAYAARKADPRLALQTSKSGAGSKSLRQQARFKDG
jgi:hypothetical protein